MSSRNHAQGPKDCTFPRPHVSRGSTSHQSLVMGWRLRTLPRLFNKWHRSHVVQHCINGGIIATVMTAPYKQGKGGIVQGVCPRFGRALCARNQAHALTSIRKRSGSKILGSI